jgi:protein SCO1/2
MSRRRLALVLAGVVVVAAVIAAAAIISSSGSQSPANGGTPASNASGALGTPIRLAVAPALRKLPPTDQRGQKVNLAAWPGRTVLLVPFLTLCQDVCPLTTGNLLQVQQSLRATGAAPNVQIVKLSVDPQRDTPARLAGYAELTHAEWELVTEPVSALRALARFFGFYYQKVPVDDPGAHDWRTGKRLGYDVDHTNNYFVIHAAGMERVENNASPDFRGQLNPKLYAFLDALGRRHLQQATQPDWTPADALDALGLVLHRSLAVVPQD